MSDTPFNEHSKLPWRYDVGDESPAILDADGNATAEKVD